MKGSRRKGEVYIPNEPFINWCREQIWKMGQDPDNPNYITGTGTRLKLARSLGISERTLYRHMSRLSGSGKPTTTIGRFGVEEMLTNAGEDFYDMYPEFAFEVDVELEQDAWCRRCAEMVTPIGGCCPWDDSVVAIAGRMAA